MSDTPRIRLEQLAAGRHKHACRFLDVETGAPLSPLHTLDLASTTGRAKLAATLDPAYHEEATALLEEAAIVSLHARVEVRTPAPPPGASVEPWAVAVDGADMLARMVTHIRRYVYLPDAASDAVALWCVLTWGLEWVTFAPLLSICSASKRCGKSTLLDVITALVRRGRLTSAGGITPAVVFRLNALQHPTFLIDEAEKLTGRHADPELVGLLNVGYRRGAVVMRCVDRNDGMEIEEFDAFGFRVLAAIGRPWDTVADRSVMIQLERKARDEAVARYHATAVEAQGAVLARQALRWITDHQDGIQTRLGTVERPAWLSDRDCDNWAGLFAIAGEAGGEWPARALDAARQLAGAREDDGDEAERLVHDMRAIFHRPGGAIVGLPSGTIVERLNEIETSPWGAKRDGRGITAHELARRLKAFGVAPRQARNPNTGDNIRGYWLADLQSVFHRYPAPAVAVVTDVTVGAGDTPPVGDEQSDLALEGVGA